MHETHLCAIDYGEVEDMGNWFVLAMLAAFGVFSALWALAGFFLPRQKGAVMVCLCRCPCDAQLAIRRYRWLNSLGLVRCQLIIMDGGLTEEERLRLMKHGWMIRTPEELASGLEQERRTVERARDDSGRDQRGDFSEL